MPSAARRYTRRFGQNIYKPDSSCVLYLEGQTDYPSATIKDLSGYGNHGTITGATWVTLPSGLKVLSFDNTDDVINCGHNTSLNITTNLTILCWINLIGGNSYSDIVSKASAYTVDGFEYYQEFQTTTTYRERFRTDGGGDAQITSTDIDNLAGRYVFACVTKEGANALIYHDGVSVHLNTTGNHSNITGNDAQDLRVGKASINNAPLNGSIGGVRILNVALSATEIANIYNSERHIYGV